MKKEIFYIGLVFFSLFFLKISSPPALAAEDKFGIQDPDCDSASKALTNLMEEIKHGKMSDKDKKYIEEKLSENTSKYEGDPDKCVMVSQDFVRVLSVDALAEFKDMKYRPTFIRLLSYLSEFQPGDMRQHAAMALAKLKAREALHPILDAIRDKNSFNVGYRESTDESARLTIGQMIQSERRDLKQDPYSYPMIGALRSLASPADYTAVRGAIESEYEEYLKGKSSWNDPIRGDMLRIAASLNGNASIDLIEKHKDLTPLQKLRSYAFINSPRIVPLLKEIIDSTLKMQSPDVPEETKLAFNMLKALKMKESRIALKQLSGSLDPSISFMANIYLAKKPENASVKEIKAKIATSQDRLKLEGLKMLAEVGDRNSIPVIKSIYSDGNIKLKVYAVWSLSNLKVKDLLDDAVKLKDRITSKDRDDSNMDLSGSLDEAVGLMNNTRSAYPSSKHRKD